MKRSLTLHLLAWCLGALALVWGVFIAVGWQTGQHEADELTDGHLASTAALLLAYGNGGGFAPAPPMQAPSGTLDLKAHDYQQSLSVVVWDAQGRVVTRSGHAPLPPFAAADGFATLRLGQPAAGWRVFSRWDEARARKVMVLLSEQERDDLADDIAGQIIEPGLWVLPAIALVLGLAIRRGLQPLYRLSDEVHALDVQVPRPLDGGPRHREFEAIAQAINTLAGRFHAALARERSLAGELAHELRTPLASLTLQAREARAQPDGAERQAALARLEADALRAGEVLSHLLSLARADRAALGEARQRVELRTLAAEVLAECAPAAARSGHELALAEGPVFEVEGHPVLLQVALRNLVENAIAHTPPGTLVEVQADANGRTLRVCDDGGRAGQAAAPLPAAQAGSGGAQPSPQALGLGLGHQVVDKIAAVHGARFERSTTPPAGFSTAYQLSF
jgi:two-component system, OmpR family, sensor histidine kinase QseC